MNMVLMLSFFHFLLFLTGKTFFSAAKGQESMEFLALHDPHEDGLSMAVHVETADLRNISNNVLKAETWLRNHVLAYYPATNISKIIVGLNVLCSKNQEHNLGFVLPSIKNIHYSLTRWGLQNDIKVAAAFSSNCLDSNSEAYRADMAETYIKPLLTTLQEMGSPYMVNIPPHLPTLMKSHFESMKKLGDFHLKMITTPLIQRPSSRKLAFIDISNMIDPFPSSPSLIAPFHSPVPNPARSSLPPLVGTVLPPSQAPAFIPTSPPSPPFLPPLAPMANPASPPFGPHLPPCNPSGSGSSVGAPVAGVHNGMWCVAKPSVPPETLQEALDYACGEGGANCDALKPDGNCYNPDSLVAHASYAFNSYWQNNKKSGGTCGFGGTAMLINSDPSYRHCRFVLT